MNALSWTLYLADFSDSVKGFTGFLTWFLCVLFVLILIVSGSMMAFAADIHDPNDKQSAFKISKWFAKLSLTVFLPLWLVAFFITSLVPSRNTLMLIAASQFGEVVLTSENAQKIGGETADLATDSLKLLHQYVQDQLGPKPDANKSDEK